MKQIEVIDFPGQESVLENYQYYKDKFIDESVIAFRNANLTYEEQKIFHKELGLCFGWNLDKGDDSLHYIENHSHNTLVNSAQQDDIMLNWHIEHVHHQNPICAATWNMYKFNANENSGKTYFIDTSIIYKNLPEEWKNFLKLCKATSENIMMSNSDDPQNQISVDYDVIKKHWITGDEIIRIVFPKDIENDKLNKLSKYNNEDPTEEQKELYLKICKYINNEIWNNQSLVIFHKWKQGDLLVPDMFKLAHAVTGGFKPEDREFRGMWGVQY